jgi:hypothetical protein
VRPPAILQAHLNERSDTIRHFRNLIILIIRMFNVYTHCFILSVPAFISWGEQSVSLLILYPLLFLIVSLWIFL